MTLPRPCKLLQRSLAVENWRGTEVSGGNPCSHLVLSLRARPTYQATGSLGPLRRAKLTYLVIGLVPPGMP